MSHQDTDFEPIHQGSATDHYLTELELYGYRPSFDDPDPRPMPEDVQIQGAVLEIMDALIGTLDDTALEPDLEDLLWGAVNLFHRAADRLGRELDDNEVAQRRGQDGQDGSEVRSVELERLIVAGKGLIARRDSLEAMRDQGAEYEAEARMLSQRSRALVTALDCAGRQKTAPIVSAKAQAVRERLARTIKQSPEVMVKITSACKGMRQIGKHLDYISRKGELELEDQDGFLLKGRDELKDLKSEWRTGGLEEIATITERRDTLNIVLSMPAHTDEVSMKRAVRAFAASEFDGHPYVFAYHTLATDPDPNPPAHPHVHLSVKIQGYSGHRLNPRKADLQRWRDAFAAQLRAHGIDANATSRLARLKRDRGDSRAVVALKTRGASVQTGKPRGESAETTVRARKLECDRRAYYALVADVLTRSEDEVDQALGSALAVSLIGRGLEPSKLNLNPEQDR